jgi:hypothetical protein
MDEWMHGWMLHGWMILRLENLIKAILILIAVRP